jgi:hypothetical protein
MAATPLVTKLLLRPGQRAALVDAPAGFRRLLAPLPEGITLSDQLGTALDFVLLFVNTRSELVRQAPAAVAATKEGGLLWIAYPKKSARTASDLSREVVWESVLPTGWRAVTQIALDEVWSALRFRPETDVTSSRR